MPSASSPKGLHIANDLRLAEGDRLDAYTLMAKKSRNTAYHTEQAAEKLLLALLTSEDVHIERKDVHQLDVLIDKLPEGHSMVSRLKPLAFLTAYATAFRYPKSGGRLPKLPDWREIAMALDHIGLLITEACAHFGVQLSASDDVPAQNVKPMRFSDDGAGGGISGGPS
jgi:HEPN domain-containing protein